MLQSMTVVKNNRANGVLEDAIIVVQQVGTTARAWLLWHVIRTHKYHSTLHVTGMQSMVMFSNFLQLPGISLLSSLADDPYPIDPYFLSVPFTIHNEHH